MESRGHPRKPALCLPVSQLLILGWTEVTWGSWPWNLRPGEVDVMVRLQAMPAGWGPEGQVPRGRHCLGNKVVNLSLMKGDSKGKGTVPWNNPQVRTAFSV